MNACSLFKLCFEKDYWKCQEIQYFFSWHLKEIFLLTYGIIPEYHTIMWS